MGRWVPFDGDVFVADLFFGYLDVLYFFFGDVLRDVLAEVLDSIVVSDCHLSGDGLHLPFLLVFNSFHLLWHTLHLGLVLVFHNLLLERHVLDSALPLDHLFSCVHSCANDLGVARNDGGADWHSTSDSFNTFDAFDAFDSVSSVTRS